VSRGRDPDDWFGGAAAGDDRADDFARGEGGEDWLRDVGEPSAPWYETIDRRVVIVAVVAVGLLIAVLAAAGVFSSGKPATTPLTPTTTAVTTSTTTTQTTPTAPAPSVPAPTATLKPGDTGAQVKLLQRALTSLGFSTGTVDGGYGPATEAATKSFQRSVGLKADGIVGPATLRALKSALQKR
jgi:hypothetical protein